MEESRVDLSDVVWIDDQRRGGGDIDPAHQAQLAARDEESTERRRFAHQREVLGGAAGAVAGSTSSLFALVGRLVHDLKPMHSVRHQSEVRHFTWCSFEDLVETLDRWGPFVLQAGRVKLRCAPGRMRSEPRRYEVDGRLHLPASRPDLRVRVVVEPWWRNRTAVTLRLRPSRRLRYPRRYFEAAHGVVSEFTTRGRASAGAGPVRHPVPT